MAKKREVIRRKPTLKSAMKKCTRLLMPFGVRIERLAVTRIESIDVAAPRRKRKYTKRAVVAAKTVAAPKAAPKKKAKKRKAEKAPAIAAALATEAPATETPKQNAAGDSF